MKKIICSPSLLAVFEGKDYNRTETWDALKKAIEITPSARFYHIDVMDGIFVEQTTAFFTDKELTSDLSHFTNTPLGVHLMVKDPIACLPQFDTETTEYITFHQEAVTNHRAVIEAIRETGSKVGISINPGTELDTIYPLLRDVDLVLLMSVIPGKCNQKYHPHITERIQTLSKKIENDNLEVIIEVDGGIKKENLYLPMNAGATMFVMGSGVYSQEDPDATIRAVQDPIYIGCDHGGLNLKRTIKEFLITRGQPFYDVGTYTDDSCDHPEIAKLVAGPIHEGEISRGILVCGTGQGMAATANRYNGVRAIIAYASELEGFSVPEAARGHNDANVFCVGERTMKPDRVVADLGVWLDAPGPQKEKYKERNNQLDTIH